MEKILEKVVFEYLKKTIEKALKLAKRNEGKRILRATPKRPEDVEIEIDKVGEEILKEILQKNNLKVEVFSETKEGNIECKNPDFFGALDPFDGSMLFLQGIEHFWYTALSFYGKDLNPIICGVGDILNKKIYLSLKEGNFVYDLETKEKKRIFPSLKESLKEKITIASYIMSSEYSKKFLEIFGDLITNLPPRCIFYPSGGSYIYAYLAAGIVDAYIMFNEPRSEIDPGFPIAKKAGCMIVEVKNNGKIEEYKFIPRSQEKKVDLLIATSTKKLLEEIVDYYFQKTKI